ncbi:hypothetical protein RJ639_030989 [Escallonia herrerae]|uniref:non-specific serine/threonine protein kinase n=1 Tax=Escallonia herrerae TaxID=1293975 RepID=A0AA88X453_9ASTE|nr:hypothetical protein RJ639_030989 [Escallonia herrerae]
MYYNLLQPYSFFFVTMIMVFILIHVPTYLSADDAQYVTCGELLQCANVPNIGYPFWGGSRPESCGYPGFQLTNCQGDAPIITVEGQQFRVLAMDNETQRLTVARQDMWNETCPMYLYNTTLDYNLFSYAPNQQNITLHYDCFEIQTQIPNRFTCNANGTASISYFTSSTISLPSLPSLPNNINFCNKSVSVPVNQTSGAALTSSSATVAEMEAALAAGFELQWAANNKRCTQCSESGGRCGYNPTTLSFACYCSDQPYALTCNSTAGVVLLPVAGIVVLSIAVLCCSRRKLLPLIAVVYWKKETTDYKNVEAFVRTYGSQFPKRYRYTDLKKMTNIFADKLGQGGYGSVFKGTLPDGHVVAVKLLSKARGNGEEFINEVASMSRTSHVNVVKLLGFCFEGMVSHKSDVYSYGMMVLEMAGVRENAEVQATRTSDIYFPDWIFEQLEPGKDLRLNGAATEDEEETARKMILVSLWCIQTNPLERPAIREVVEMLEGSLQSLQIPPKPTWSAPLTLAQGTSSLFPQSSESNI